MQNEAATQRADRAQRRLDNPGKEMQKARDWATTSYEGAKEQYERAQAEKKRADAAEVEVGKYKAGKKSQDGRIRSLHDEVAALKKAGLQPSVLQTAEVQATKNDFKRAEALICEYCNQCYEFATRQVVVRLCKANDKIVALKRLLQKPATWPSQLQCLRLLLDAEVEKQAYEGLFNPDKRQVLIRQCAAVNAKLMVLKDMINGEGGPNKAELLGEIFKPRGDEEAWWNMEPEESPPPSSDEDASDEDEADDRGDGGNDGSEPSPGAFPRALPTGPRPRPGAPKKAEGQDSPMPSDPNSNNPLKRKGNDDDMEPEGSSKRHDASGMGMRPIGGPSAQQGSSSPGANDEQSETKAESQDDVPSSERIGEAAAPQQQSNDQTDFSPQLPGSPSFPIQHVSPVNAAFSSLDLSHTEHALHSKPTKIPGPKSTAYSTTSNGLETLPVRQYTDTKAASAQEAATPSSSITPTVFSFSAPKDIASGILPHVRTYTRLSGTTNTVLSRGQTNASTAIPQPNFQRTVTVGRGFSEQEVSTTRTSTDGRRSP